MNRSLHKNRALSPYGYWPNSNRNQNFQLIRLLLKGILIAFTISFFTVSGCGAKKADQRHILNTLSMNASNQGHCLLNSVKWDVLNVGIEQIYDV